MKALEESIRDPQQTDGVAIEIHSNAIIIGMHEHNVLRSGMILYKSGLCVEITQTSSQSSIISISIRLPKNIKEKHK